MFNFLKKKTKKYATTGNIFPQLNTNYIIDNLQILKLAKRDGEQNIPTQHATNISYTESLIESEIQKEILNSEKIFHQKKSLYESEILQLVNSKADYEVESCHHKVISDFETTNRRWRGQLMQYREKMEELLEDLKSFKKSNNITRSAKYPSNIKKNMAIIFILMIVETIINGTFLAKGIDTGLIGGWITAGVFSAINLFLGGLCGLISFRYINHKNIFYKILSIISFAIFTTSSLCINLLLTQYRDLSVINPDNITFNLIVSNIKESILNYSDPMSPIVLIIATIFFIISAIDLYYIDDSYPGYGDIDKRYNKARLKFDLKKDEYIDDLEDRRNEALESIKDTIKTIHKNEQKQKEYIGRLKNLPNIYRSHIQHLENIFIQTVNIYRDINRKYRTEAHPAYFDSKPTLQHNQLDSTQNIDALPISILNNNAHTNISDLANIASKSIIDEYNKSQQYYNL